jgi:TonB-dependent SusC/RagA subfamily outer membrane receptor
MPATGEATMAGCIRNALRAHAAGAGLALALSAGCAHGARTAAQREAELRRAVAAFDSAGRDDVDVGYGVRLRRNVLGPVGSVDLTRDASRPRSDRIEDLFEGRVAGVEVRRLSNGELSVRVRGAGGLAGDGEPLYVVDGIPMPSGAPARQFLRDVNPGDVARIDVLKGSAASIYGSRGSNGVVLITLRRDYRPR